MVRVRYLSPAPLNGDDALERSMLAKQPWAAHVVRQRQARAAPAQAVAAQQTPPAMSILAAVSETAAPQLVTKKGGLAPEMSAGGWVTNAQPN